MDITEKTRAGARDVKDGREFIGVGKEWVAIITYTYRIGCQGYLLPVFYHNSPICHQHDTMTHRHTINCTALLGGGLGGI